VVMTRHRYENDTRSDIIRPSAVPVECAVDGCVEDVSRHPGEVEKLGAGVERVFEVDQELGGIGVLDGAKVCIVSSTSSASQIPSGAYRRSQWPRARRRAPGAPKPERRRDRGWKT